MKRELGSSNKLFYYTLADRGTFNMRINMRLKENVKPALLSEACEKAMPLFPEFAIKVHRENGHLFQETNPDEVKILKEDGKTHYFADTDTNSYLFYFSYNGPKLTFSCFHGLADFKGYMVFLRTVLLFYAVADGRIFSEEELESLRGNVRFSQKDIPADEEELYDPYVKYTKDYVPDGNGEAPVNAAAIHTEQYPEESGELNLFEISLNNTEYREKAGELGATSASLLAAVVASATFCILPEQCEDPVVAMLPVDLRRLFGANTLVNFSDGILLREDKKDLTLPLGERCGRIRASMKAQISAGSFRPVMKAKVEQVKTMEENDNVREMIERSITLPAPGSFSPFTYALTFPGSLSMGTALDPMLDDVSSIGFARASSVVASSFGDTMRILITYRSDDPAWPEAIRRELEALGLETEMKRMGKHSGDVILPESYL